MCNVLNPIIVLFAAFILQPLNAVAWNIPGHLVHGAIAYQLLMTFGPKPESNAKSSGTSPNGDRGGNQMCVRVRQDELRCRCIGSRWPAHVEQQRADTEKDGN